jgi:ferritin-like metal-binding protein YciE
MAAKASHGDLRNAFNEHLEQTQEHVRRLETVFDQLGMQAEGKPCKGIRGIIAEGEEFLEADADPDVRDAALITAAQRVEHYEMAAYGAVRTYARRLNFDDQASILQQTLDEEGEANKRLTRLAEGGVNEDAQMK